MPKPHPPKPEPYLSSGNPNKRMPIGEVHVFVYDWKQGQSEAQVRYPVEALPGAAPNAGELRHEFERLVSDALNDVFALSDNPPPQWSE